MLARRLTVVAWAFFAAYVLGALLGLDGLTQIMFTGLFFVVGAFWLTWSVLLMRGAAPARHGLLTSPISSALAGIAGLVLGTSIAIGFGSGFGLLLWLIAAGAVTSGLFLEIRTFGSRNRSTPLTTAMAPIEPPIYRLRGGARITLSSGMQYQATWPFATVELHDRLLTLSVWPSQPILAPYLDIESTVVKRQFFSALFGTAVEIRFREARRPPLLIYSWSPGRLIDVMRARGVTVKE